MKNAIIMAAGTSSRFVPLSEEKPKGLLEVRGEILIERQIRQLKEAGVKDIFVVVGYKAFLFEYLTDKYGVQLVYNEDFYRYNNISSLIRVVDKLDETFICCSDHYFARNVFEDVSCDSYYAVRYSPGPTNEWCVFTDETGRIREVLIGGENAWYLAGHAFLTSSFSQRFRALLENEYEFEEVRYGYWENVLIRHLEELPIFTRKYKEEDLWEFDSIDELRAFDSSYFDDTRSRLLKEICAELHCQEHELSNFERVKHSEDYLLFKFQIQSRLYIYNGRDKSIQCFPNE